MADEVPISLSMCVCVVREGFLAVCPFPIAGVVHMIGFATLPGHAPRGGVYLHHYRTHTSTHASAINSIAHDSCHAEYVSLPKWGYRWHLRVTIHVHVQLLPMKACLNAWYDVLLLL